MTTLHKPCRRCATTEPDRFDRESSSFCRSCWQALLRQQHDDGFRRMIEPRGSGTFYTGRR
jgi:hypothetical protein